MVASAFAKEQVIRAEAQPKARGAFEPADFLAFLVVGLFSAFLVREYVRAAHRWADELVHLMEGVRAEMPKK
jgi:hypothetical protein